MTATSLQSVQGLKLERFFGELGGKAEHLLCTSDVEPYRLRDLLELADDELRVEWDRLALGYTDPGGMPALREEIAGMYASIEADDVVTFAGADEAIFLALNAILRPGDHAVVIWPAYQSLHEVAHVRIPPGGATSVHTHPGPELIYQLTGRILYQNALIGTVELGPAGPEGIPPGTAVQKRNRFDADAEFLSWFLVDPEEPFAPGAEFRT